MITFFRKLRGNTMQSSGYKKYAIYAIGEVILVVIGILIALEVNNINQNRQDRDKEQLLLKRLQSSFENDLDQLERKIRTRELMIDYAQGLLKHIDSGQIPENDSILSNAVLLLFAPTFNATDLGLNNDNIELIQNEELKSALTTWGTDIIDAFEDEMSWIRFRDDHMHPFFLKSKFIRNTSHAFWKNSDPLIYLIDQDIQYKIDMGPSQTGIGLREFIKLPGLEDHCVMLITLNLNSQFQAFAIRERLLEIQELIAVELE